MSSQVLNTNLKMRPGSFGIKINDLKKKFKYCCCTHCLRNRLVKGLRKKIVNIFSRYYFLRLKEQGSNL